MERVDCRQRDVLPLDGLGDVQQARHVADGALRLETHDAAVVRRTAHRQPQRAVDDRSGASPCIFIYRVGQK